MDGFATLASIRQREALKDIPIIILTGTRHKQKVIKGITSGVAGYIVKPADSEQLISKIEAALNITGLL
jgi:DNA-binding response OmpR family regulator